MAIYTGWLIWAGMQFSLLVIIFTTVHPFPCLESRTPSMYTSSSSLDTFLWSRICLFTRPISNFVFHVCSLIAMAFDSPSPICPLQQLVHCPQCTHLDLESPCMMPSTLHQMVLVDLYRQMWLLLLSRHFDDSNLPVGTLESLMAMLRYLLRRPLERHLIPKSFSTRSKRGLGGTSSCSQRKKRGGSEQWALLVALRKLKDWSWISVVRFLPDAITLLGSKWN